MLFTKKLTPGAGGNGAQYYTELAGKDLAAYYAGVGEAPGVWLGSGLDDLCRTLGVAPVASGQLMDAEAAKLFEFLNSKEAARKLFPPQRRPSKDTGGAWVSGFDLTFSSCKGLSVLALLTDDDNLRKAIYEAHEESVRQTMAAIEHRICYGREGKNGIDLVPGDGLIAAGFRHRTSRPAADGDLPDPHLHTHVVVSNIVRHPDGTYGALDGRALTGVQSQFSLMGGALYDTAIRAELEKRGRIPPVIATTEGELCDRCGHGTGQYQPAKGQFDGPGCESGQHRRSRSSIEWHRRPRSTQRPS